jgi:hypothetical protein
MRFPTATQQQQQQQQQKRTGVETYKHTSDRLPSVCRQSGNQAVCAHSLQVLLAARALPKMMLDMN